MKKTFLLVISFILCFGFTACSNKEINKYSGSSTKNLIDYFEKEGFKFSLENKNDYISVNLINTDEKIKFSRTRLAEQLGSDIIIPSYEFYNLDESSYSYIDFTYELDEYEIEELSYKEEKLYKYFKEFLDDRNISSEQIKEVLDNYFNKNADQKYIDMEKEKTEIIPSTDTSTENSDAYKMIQLEKQLILNKYEEYDNHNWSQEEIIDSQKLTKHFNTEYKIFTLSDEYGNSVGYQYDLYTAGIGDCNYDYKTDTPKEGSICSSEQLTTIKNARKIFLNEMSKFNITEYN